MKLSKYIGIDLSKYPLLRRLKLHLGIFFGFYEDGLVDIRKVINQYVKKDFICIDIGASIGDVTRLLSKKAKYIYSFEPQKSSYADLLKRFHNTKNITVYDCALSNKQGKFYFYEREYSCHSSLLSDGLSKVTNEYEVIGLTLDSFHIVPDFIKIDTEGNEIEVLLGGRSIIRQYKPIIFVECWQDKKKETQIYDFLHECGYTDIQRFTNDILAIK